MTWLFLYHMSYLPSTIIIPWAKVFQMIFVSWVVYGWFLMAYFVVCSKMESGYLCYYCNEKFDLFKDIFNHLIEKHNAETFKKTADSTLIFSIQFFIRKNYVFFIASLYKECFSRPKLFVQIQSKLEAI
jgi:hypothetical protein